jgi:hypothetical protein
MPVSYKSYILNNHSTGEFQEFKCKEYDDTLGPKLIGWECQLLIECTIPDELMNKSGVRLIQSVKTRTGYYNPRKECFAIYQSVFESFPLDSSKRKQIVIDVHRHLRPYVQHCEYDLRLPKCCKMVSDVRCVAKIGQVKYRSTGEPLADDDVSKSTGSKGDAAKIMYFGRGAKNPGTGEVEKNETVNPTEVDEDGHEKGTAEVYDMDIEGMGVMVRNWIENPTSEDALLQYRADPDHCRDDRSSMNHITPDPYGSVILVSQQPLLEDFLRAMAEANEPPMPTPVGDPTLGLVTPGVQIPEVDIEASLSAWV